MLCYAVLCYLNNLHATSEMIVVEERVKRMEYEDCTLQLNETGGAARGVSLQYCAHAMKYSTRRSDSE